MTLISKMKFARGYERLGAFLVVFFYINGVVFRTIFILSARVMFGISLGVQNVLFTRMRSSSGYLNVSGGGPQRHNLGRNEFLITELFSFYSLLQRAAERATQT